MSTKLYVDDETRRLIKNYNAKVTRETGKGRMAPSRLKLSEFANLENGEQYLFKVHMEAYNKRGAFDVQKNGLTKYEMDYAQTLLDKVNATRAERKALLHPSPYKGNMMLVEEADVEPRTLKFENTADFQRSVDSLMREAKPGYWEGRDEIYKESLIKSAREHMGSKFARKLKAKLKNLTGTQVYLAGLNNPELHIDFQYGKEQIEEKEQLILSKWDEIIAEG